MDGISVIICCYNSASRIAETLKFAFNLNVSGNLFYEIILVDNNSTDTTKLVALESSKVNEPTSGLTSARKRGMSEAQYDLVLFCDDDNHLSSDYLINTQKIFNEHATVGIVGGWCRPKFPFYPGKWIEGNYAALATEPFAKQSGYVDWVFGAGMVIRKKIFEQLKARGIHFMLSDRVGAKQTSGGDGEICQLTKFIGYEVYYSSELILDHAISANRLSRRSFVKANFLNVYPVAYFYALTALIQDQKVGGDRLYLNFFNKLIKDFLYFIPRTVFGRNRFYSFIMLFQTVQLIGWLVSGKRKFNNLCKMIMLNLYP
jgi:glycosyltransferase involved in cell wall biosynthesis